MPDVQGSSPPRRMRCGYGLRPNGRSGEEHGRAADAEELARGRSAVPFARAGLEPSPAAPALKPSCAGEEERGKEKGTGVECGRIRLPYPWSFRLATSGWVAHLLKRPEPSVWQEYTYIRSVEDHQLRPGLHALTFRFHMVVSDVPDGIMSHLMVAGMGSMAPESQKKPHGIAAWPEEERPRERLLSRGPHALTDAELVAILIRVGFQGTNAVELGRQLLQRFGSLRAMAEASVTALLDVKGLKGARRRNSWRRWRLPGEWPCRMGER